MLQELYFFESPQKIGKLRNSTLIYSIQSNYLKSLTLVPELQTHHPAEIIARVMK